MNRISLFRKYFPPNACFRRELRASISHRSHTSPLSLRSLTSLPVNSPCMPSLIFLDRLTQKWRSKRHAGEKIASRIILSAFQNSPLNRWAKRIVQFRLFENSKLKRIICNALSFINPLFSLHWRYEFSCAKIAGSRRYRCSRAFRRCRFQFAS